MEVFQIIIWIVFGGIFFGAMDYMVRQSLINKAAKSTITDIEQACHNIAIQDSFYENCTVVLEGFEYNLNDVNEHKAYMHHKELIKALEWYNAH